MAQNKLSDLNNHLFAQLERLSDENIKSDDMEAEIRKAKAISQISGQIIKGAALALSAAKMVSEGCFTENEGANIKRNLLS